MSQRFYAWAIPICICIGLIAVLGLLADRAIWHDYGVDPPAQVFQMVRGTPVPAGVTNLRVSGRQLFIKGWVWATFKTTPAARAKIVAGAEPISAWELKVRYGGLKIAANSRYDARDKKRVGWNALSTAGSPRYFKVTNFDRSMDWLTFIVVDMKSGRVFMQSEGG